MAVTRLGVGGAAAAYLGFSDKAQAPIVVVVVFGDLTTVFTAYLTHLRTLHPTAVDTQTLLTEDEATIRASTQSEDDLNTAYAQGLS
jgi:uncharacterized membrane protein (DUF106 family)